MRPVAIWFKEFCYFLNEEYWQIFFQIYEFVEFNCKSYLFIIVR